jgi:hypothetical protein
MRTVLSLSGLTHEAASLEAASGRPEMCAKEMDIDSRIETNVSFSIQSRPPVMNTCMQE